MFERSQLKPGFLRGGMAIVGRLNYFVAFHNEFPSGVKLAI